MVKVISHYLEQNMRGVDAITYTGQNVKDQASADKAIQRQAEVDAAIKLPQIIINKRAQLVFLEENEEK